MPGGTTVQSSLPAAAIEDGLTDEDVALEDDELTTEEEVVEEYALGPQTDEERLEAQARLLGWRPIAEYSGPPGKWVPAQTFLERGEQILPIVQRDRRELLVKVEAMSGELAAMRAESARSAQETARLLEYARRQRQEGYDQAMRELKAKQREAASAGDISTFDQVSTELEQLERERAKDPEVQPPAPPARQPQPRPQAALAPAYATFIEANPWVNMDPVLNRAMIEEHNLILADTPGMELSEQLQEAKARVMDRYPDKFGRKRDAAPAPAPTATPRRPAAPMAPTTPSAPRGPRRGEDPFDQIEDATERAQARAGYTRMRRSSPDLKPSEYIAIFQNPKADVLGVMDEAGTSRKAKVKDARR